MTKTPIAGRVLVPGTGMIMEIPIKPIQVPSQTWPSRVVQSCFQRGRAMFSMRCNHGIPACTHF